MRTCLSAQVEQTLKHDRYLSAHYRYYAREMRILAYKQLLESYSSLTLDYMSKAFGISVSFIDQSVIIYSQLYTLLQKTSHLSLCMCSPNIN